MNIKDFIENLLDNTYQYNRAKRHIRNLESSKTKLISPEELETELQRDWECEYCYCCARPVSLGYNLPDEIWMEIVEDENKILCLGCLDFIAFHKGIDYVKYLKELFYTSRREPSKIFVPKEDKRG